MQYEDLEYAAEDGIAVLTLNRPEARNAYSDAMITSLISALDRIEADDSIHGAILTGAGKAFHAGGDLKAMQSSSGMFAGGPVALRRQYIDGIHRVPQRLAQFDKPIIAAVNGAAIGAGLDLACMCDVRIAARTAKLGSTFVKVGLVPGDGGTYFLTRVVGFARALELVLTGRIVEGDEAQSLGLVHQLVERDEVLDAAKTMARTIAANAPLAVRLAKRAAYRSYDADMQTALELAASYQGMVQNTADHQEAVAAILGKRPPVFEGR